MKPVLCDVDGVLCGFMQRCLEIAAQSGKCQKIWTYEETEGDIRELSLWEECGLEEAWLSEGFCADLPIIQGAQEFIESVRKMDLKIVFVTSPPQNSKTWPYERSRWLERHFGAKRGEVIFATDKRYVDGLVLIDDHERNITEWQQYNKKPAIMVAQPWNKKVLNDCEEHEGMYLHKDGFNLYRAESFEKMLEYVRRFRRVQEKWSND